MKPMKTLLCLFLVVAAMAALPTQGLADRLYTWTDDKGVSHVTQHPPPAKAKNKEVVEYSHRTHERQQAPAASREKETALQRKAEQAVSDDSGNVEQYRKEIRKDMEKKPPRASKPATSRHPAEGSTCVFSAPTASTSRSRKSGGGGSSRTSKR